MSLYTSISPDEWSLCVQVGHAREMDSIKRKGKDNLNKKDNWLDELNPHIVGCVGELAVAKVIGVSWTGDVGTFASKSDLSGNVQVRHRTNPTWQLIVRDKDKDDDLFILSRGMPPSLVEVVGWIQGRDAKNAEWLKDYGNYGKPSFFVPDNQLKSMEEWNGKQT